MAKLWGEEVHPSTSPLIFIWKANKTDVVTNLSSSLVFVEELRENHACIAIDQP